MKQLSLTAACISDTGLRRANNEDNIFFNGIVLPVDHNGTEEILSTERKDTEETLIFAVFDGVGGADDGQIASFTAAEALKDMFLSEKEDDAIFYTDINITMLIKIFERMHNSVSAAAKHSFSNMATTAVLLCVCGKKIIIGNVGDSRALLFRRKKLRQISKDHTDAEILKKCNALGRKPRLTQCLGMSGEDVMVSPHITNEKAKKGDKYIICSDGLTDMLSFSEIESILQDCKDTVDCASRLKASALANGGRDNITLTVIEIS